MPGIAQLCDKQAPAEGLRDELSRLRGSGPMEAIDEDRDQPVPVGGPHARRLAAHTRVIEDGSAMTVCPAKSLHAWPGRRSAPAMPDHWDPGITQS